MICRNGRDGTMNILLALALGPRAGAELRGAVIDAAWAEWRVRDGPA